jgi:hypothetical protein
LVIKSYLTTIHIDRPTRHSFFVCHRTVLLYFCVLALSPLFIKVWRMAKLLSSDQIERSKLSNVQAFVYTLPLIAIEMLLLMIFSFVDPPRQTEQLGVGDGIGVQQVTCQHETEAFYITQVVFDGKYRKAKHCVVLCLKIVRLRFVPCAD